MICLKCGKDYPFYSVHGRCMDCGYGIIRDNIPPVAELRDRLAECLWLLNTLCGFESDIKPDFPDGLKKIYWNAKEALGDVRYPEVLTRKEYDK